MATVTTATKAATVVRRITPSQAARILVDAGFNCNDKMNQRWCRIRTLRKSKKVGGQWYVDEAEVRGMIGD